MSTYSVSPDSPLWTVYDYRRSHPSARVALATDGASQGVPRSERYVAEVTFASYDGGRECLVAVCQPCFPLGTAYHAVWAMFEEHGMGWADIEARLDERIREARTWGARTILCRMKTEARLMQVSF